MRLSNLMDAVGATRVWGAADPEITGLAYDSRKVVPGNLFIAIRGERQDGHAFIPAALERGAAAVLGEKLEGVADPSAIFVEVENVRKAMAEAAGVYYGRPAQQIGLIGITGTNGKTTTAYLIRSVLETAGRKSGLIGTVEYRIGDTVVPAPRTTPESVDLQRYLGEMEETGTRYAVMEVSSHALELERVHGCAFRVAVFSNLTRDHLDFHRDMDHYYAAKKKLFDQLEEGGVAVINIDDAHGRRLAGNLRENHSVLTYGMTRSADISAEAVEMGLRGTGFTLRYRDRTYRVAASLLGAHNVYNMLAAFGTGIGLGLPIELILDGITELDAVPGRFERIDLGQEFLVLVDYAHTDDALEHAIQSARELTDGRVVTVFGCGGERDRSKRPRMGAVATGLSDYVILTTDNARNEDAKQIFQDIRKGISRFNYLVVPDREKAIRHAVDMVSRRDVVLIAGKGHEAYQETGGVRMPFNDRDAARAAVEARVAGVRSG